MLVPEIESTKSDTRRVNRPGNGNLLGWFLVLLAGVPAIVLMSLAWRLFFAPEVHAWSFVVALVLGTVLTVATLKRANRLVRLGVHPYWQSQVPKEFRVRLSIFSFFVILAYVWALLLAAILFSSHSLERRAFTVSNVSECTGPKCAGCHFRVTLEQWRSLGSGELCAHEEVWRSLKPGVKVFASGYFSDHVLYADSIEIGQ